MRLESCHEDDDDERMLCCRTVHRQEEAPAPAQEDEQISNESAGTSFWSSASVSPHQRLLALAPLLAAVSLLL